MDKSRVETLIITFLKHFDSVSKQAGKAEGECPMNAKEGKMKQNKTQ